MLYTHTALRQQEAAVFTEEYWNEMEDRYAQVSKETYK